MEGIAILQVRSTMRTTTPAALWGMDQNEPQSSDVTLRGSSTLSLEGMKFRRRMNIYENMVAIKFGAGACGADVVFKYIISNYFLYNESIFL